MGPKLKGRIKLATTVLTVVALSLGVSLALAEVLVRLVAPQQLIQIRPDLWQPADTIGWVRRPNASVEINTGERPVHVYTDAEGFRVGRDGRPEADVQVLLIGDSFIEALQVEHEATAAYLLERELERRLAKPVAVRNAGVSGWGPNHYRLRTRQLLARDTFDLVVVALFVGNDAITYRFDSIPARAPVERSHFRFPRRVAWSEIVESLLAPINDALEVRSHLFILCKNQFATLRMRLGMTADYLPLEYQLESKGSTRWQNTAEISRDLAGEAMKHRVPVLFALIPERFQVYPDEFRRYVQGFGIDSTTVDVDQPSVLLNASLAGAGLRVVDALPAFRAAAAVAATPRLFGTVDQHLSPEGHRVLAATLITEIEPLLRR